MKIKLTLLSLFLSLTVAKVKKMDTWLKTGRLEIGKKRKSTDTNELNEPKEANAKKPNNLKFQRSWLDEFNWLRFVSSAHSLEM